jgi:cell division protease FtsH
MSKKPQTPPPGDRPAGSAPPPAPAWRHWLWLVWLLIVLLWVVPSFIHVHTTPVSQLNYSQFVRYVGAHKIKTASVPSPASADANVTVTGALRDGKDYSVTTPYIPPGSSLDTSMRDAGVAITYQAPSSSEGYVVLELLLWIVLPLIILFLFFRWMARRAGSPLQGVMGVGRARAKVFDAEKPSTKFSDVAGYDGVKSEITEVVDFLRNPDRYRRAGAMAPRGVLMVGPPGTGKTLIARAVAGEANVPFFSVTGSSFVEMFVGVGAARVRDLFAEARKAAPAIIFIDEIDAIGQRRAGTGAVVSNDEREQTLNQLLSEMDGFDVTAGIVVLGATNRPEVLDPALLRPGRFDRQIVIPLPTLSERAAILAVHCRDKKLGPDVDLEVVARGTPGFSGADLANLANEAAIFAVRDGRDVLSAADFDNARDRILLGRREGSNVLLPEEKHSVAVHESGHALVAALSPHADPVAKITILPAGQTLGVTEQLPIDERHLYSEDYLRESLAVRLGGRGAELVELGQGSTGAANDLASATDLAVKMVREFGLSSKLGPVGYPEGGSVFLGGGQGLSSRPFAEATQATIDHEVSRLLREAEETAVSLIRSHHDELMQLVDLLLEHETVDGSEVYRIVGKPMPERRPEQMTIAPHAASVDGAGSSSAGSSSPGSSSPGSSSAGAASASPAHPGSAGATAADAVIEPDQ